MHPTVVIFRKLFLREPGSAQRFPRSYPDIKMYFAVAAYGLQPGAYGSHFQVFGAELRLTAGCSPFEQHKIKEGIARWLLAPAAQPFAEIGFDPGNCWATG